MTTKQCTVCKQDKPEKAFVAYRGKRHSECKECEKTVQRCVTCGVLKALEKFSREPAKRNGRHSVCMECNATANRERGRENADEINARRRRHYETDPAYRAKCQARTAAFGETSEGKAHMAAYNRSEAGKARAKRYKQKELVREFNRWYMNEYGKARAKDPGERGLKVKARNAVNMAVYRGLLAKPAACEDCGDSPVQAHHHKGYAPEHWLDVQWLCPACHRKAEPAKEPA